MLIYQYSVYNSNKIKIPNRKRKQTKKLNGLRYHTTCQLKNQPATFSRMLTKDTGFLGQSYFITHSAENRMNIIIFASILLVPAFHRVTEKGLDG